MYIWSYLGIIKSIARGGKGTKRELIACAKVICDDDDYGNNNNGRDDHNDHNDDDDDDDDDNE